MDFLEYLKAEGFEVPSAFQEHYNAYAKAEIDLVGHLQKIVSLSAEEPPTPMQMLIIQALVALSQRENASSALQRAWMEQLLKPVQAKLSQLEENSA
jgi:hypothetical protein